MFLALFHNDKERNREIFKIAGDLCRSVYGISEIVTKEFGETAVLLGREPGLNPVWASNARGWFLVQGLPFDVRSDNPIVEPGELLTRFQENFIDLNQLEGAFSLVAWDDKEKKALVLGDQAGTLLTFYGHFRGCSYVSSASLLAAKALGLGVSPAGAREFFGRGCITAPNTLFSGMRCLDVGLSAELHDDTFTTRRHWDIIRDFARMSFGDAVEGLVELAVDRTRRFSKLRSPVLYDLTSGYDSRFNICTALAAGIPFGVTVNGPDTSIEVRIAKKVADLLGVKMHHFDPATVWTKTIDGSTRRELLYRTGGGLRFTEAYHHLLTRPSLATTYAIHVSGGVGTDILRYHAWSHELLGVGRRRQANVTNLLRYRVFQEGPPPSGLFRSDWFGALSAYFRQRADEIHSMRPDSLNTQMLEAFHTWKMTGHFSQYCNALSGWLQSAPVTSSAGIIAYAATVPWRYKLTAGLIRSGMASMSTEAAAVETQYGNTAAPARLRTAHKELIQIGKRLGHLADKLNRVLLGGRLSRFLPQEPSNTSFRRPVFTGEFMAAMDAGSMNSRNLFHPARLAELMRPDAESLYSREKLVLTVATFELICRELDVRPDADFLTRSN